MRVRLSMFSVSCATFIRCYYKDTISKTNYFRGKACSKNSSLRRWRRGGGVQGLTPLYRPIRGCTAGQGMVFVLSVLNRVYDFVRVCPKQVYNFLRVYNQVYNFVGVRLNCKQGIVCCGIDLICLMKFVCTPVYKSIDYYVYLLYCNFQ